MSTTPDPEVQDGLRSLAERDDILGAQARVVLALERGEEPDTEDCDAAGVPTLPEVVP